jgi:hypothetical protein
VYLGGCKIYPKPDCSAISGVSANSEGVPKYINLSRYIGRLRLWGRKFTALLNSGGDLATLLKNHPSRAALLAGFKP